MIEKTQNSEEVTNDEPDKTMLALNLLWDPSPETSSKLHGFKSIKVKLAFIALTLAALLFWQVGVPYLMHEQQYVSQGTTSKNKD